MNEMTPKAMQQLDQLFQLNREALDIFELVVAEWSSDPQSVQCFDLRIVERARLIQAQRKELKNKTGRP